MNKIMILCYENPDADSIISGYLLEKKVQCQVVLVEPKTNDKWIGKRAKI